MDVDKLQMDQDQARELYRAYRDAKAPKTANDRAIASIYKRIAQGKLVIRALASITAAGLDAAGLPKLAITRADLPKVVCVPRGDEVTFNGANWRGTVGSHAKDRSFTIPMPGSSWHTNRRQADVPLIPVQMRPMKSALKNYHILWEADWNAYPVDPYLLRRFGTDAWLVVAAWELTDIERAVMSSRLNA